MWSPEEHIYKTEGESYQVKEEPGLYIKPEPEEVPLHIVTVKKEDDDDKSSVRHLTAAHENTQGIKAEDESPDADRSDSYQKLQERSDVTCSPDDSAGVQAAHSNSETSPKPHVCSVCEKSLKDEAALRLHLVAHVEQSSNTLLKLYSCPLCEAEFRNSYQFVKHKHIICPLCQKPFSNKGKLYSHLKTHVDVKNLEHFLKPHHCSVCERRFESVSELQRHLCARPRIYKCDLCRRCFKDQAALKEHLLRRVCVRPHTCQVCGKEHSSHSLLQRHVMYHSGERPFSCALCTKRFISQDELNKHTSQAHPPCAFVILKI
ncbi:unnamed protein product [Knipowitschia caucasica]|uniref:C2H2-type domain-containing protein n=1 Tax=Knipowitschia caucasica TaxID=637954 RepID=A0AAV2M413_KNICA